VSVTQADTALEEIFKRYAADPALADLARGKHMVAPSGRTDSPLMVVGEAPGADEERTGRPFTGPAGRLVRGLFDQAGLPWAWCYVTNTVPWRPDGNRDPYPFEVQHSYARLAEEAELVKPEVIVAAGDVAWRGLTQGDLGRFGDARFRWHDLHGRRLLAIPHPSFILRVGSRFEQEQWKAQTVTALKSALGTG
jgi:uracil-DNA glycosylase family 4